LLIPVSKWKRRNDENSLIDVDPQGSGGSDTAGKPPQRTDYYLS
jgi:hypothetical protein